MHHTKEISTLFWHVSIVTRYLTLPIFVCSNTVTLLIFYGCHFIEIQTYLPGVMPYGSYQAHLFSKNTVYHSIKKIFGFQNDTSIIYTLWLIRNVIVNIGSCSLIKLILCKMIISIQDQVINLKKRDVFFIKFYIGTHYINGFTYLLRIRLIRTHILITGLLMNYCSRCILL